jgi:hypothetical protein
MEATEFGLRKKLGLVHFQKLLYQAVCFTFISCVLETSSVKKLCGGSSEYKTSVIMPVCGRYQVN